jgi:hypothetical protein
MAGEPRRGEMRRLETRRLEQIPISERRIAAIIGAVHHLIS